MIQAMLDDAPRVHNLSSHAANDTVASKLGTPAAWHLRLICTRHHCSPIAIAPREARPRARALAWCLSYGPAHAWYDVPLSLFSVKSIMHRVKVRGSNLRTECRQRL